MECECNTIPIQNTLRTRVKQIRNPQKEIFGGFSFIFHKLKIIADKDMRKMSNIVENLIRRFVESRV